MGRPFSKEVWEVDCMDCGRSRDLKKKVSRCPFLSCMSSNIEVRPRPTMNISDLWVSNEYTGAGLDSHALQLEIGSEF